MPSACPFCNAPLPALAAPPATEKLPCPRCSEPVPAARWPIDPAANVMPRPDEAVELSSRKRMTLYVVLGIMAAMFMVALVFALVTAGRRAERHPRPKEVAPELVVKAPLELEALAYLPADYHVLAGLHVRELLQDPAGKHLLADALPGPDVLLKRTGLRLDQIDHIAAAGQLDKRATRATVVVRTILPYDQPAVSQAVQPAKASLRQKQPLFQFALPKLGDGYLWCVDARTLILAFVLETANPDPLYDIPATPQPARDLPTPLLKRAATERLARQSRLWLAADLEAATVLRDLLALAGGLPKDLQPLTKVKAMAAGVYPQDGVTLLAQFYTGDPKAAKAVESLLEARRWPAAKSFKVEGPPPGETAAPAQWVTLQVRSDAEALGEMLSKLKSSNQK